jgi:hypothetical protein
MLRLRSEREGIPCDEYTGAVDAIGTVLVLVLLSARSMQGDGNVDVARAMVFSLRVSWGAVAAASEGKASRAHTPALKATV